MRNLKRALSLALASVMLLGMMVVGTSAAGYPDVDAQDNLEAIEVMKLLGVMAGDENGNFNPDKYVTRNEMAVIMTHLLKLTAGGTTPFTDVPAWAQPYVAACYERQVVAGTSATTFGGNDTVTAAQAALMVMKALGYFQYQGEFKNDWQLAVVAQADKINLFDGINARVGAPMTRNEVAKLCLNALNADVVVATESGGASVSTGDVNVIVSATYTYDKVKNDSGDKIQQLSEKLFAKKLTKGDAEDEFGRPAVKWTYAGKSVTAAKAAKATYTAEVNGKTIYADLGLGSSDTKNVATIKDGADVPGVKTISKSDKDNKWGGNGAVVEVYTDDSDKDGVIDGITAVVVNTYVGKIDSVTAAKNDKEAYVTIKKAVEETTVGTFETEAFAKDDIVLYTVGKDEADKDKIVTVKLAEKVSEAEVTKVVGTSNFVAGGTTYKYSATAVKEGDKKIVPSAKDIIDLYLDEYGYVIYTKGSSSSTDYAYVLSTGKDKAIFDNDYTFYAKLLLADGTVAEVTLNGDAEAHDTVTEVEALKGAVVTYEKNSKDKYTLTDKGAATISGIEFTKGKTAIKGTDSEDKAVTKYANAKTLFLVQKGTGDKATYTAYTGYANAPSLKSKSAEVYCKTGNVATVVYVSDASATSSTKDIIFVLGSKEGENVQEGDLKYTTVKAVVNGEITTINVHNDYIAKVVANGDELYSSVVYDDDKLVTSLEKYETNTSKDKHVVKDLTVAKDAVKDGTIAAGDEVYALADNVTVIEIVKTAKGASDKFDTAALGDIDAGETVTLVVNDGAVVAIFLINK